MPIEQDKMQLILAELVRRTNDELLRIRNLEDRMAGAEDRLGNMEDSVLQRTKKSNETFAELDATIKSVTDETMRLKSIIEKLSKQLGNVALKRDVKELERMFDLLSPVRGEYVTREELAQ